MKETRKGFFEKLLGGGENAETVLKAAEGAAQALDTAGVARKEGDAAMMLAQNIAAALAAAGVSLPDTAVETILAPIQAAVAPAAEATPEAVPTAVSTEEEEAKAKSLPEPAPTSAQTAALNTLLQQQSDYIASTTKDMGEMAGAMVSMVELFKALSPLAESVKGLEGRLGEIETKLKERPRSASQDESTVILNAEVEKQLKASANETKAIWGIPVKE